MGLHSPLDGREADEWDECDRRTVCTSEHPGCPEEGDPSHEDRQRKPSQHNDMPLTPTDARSCC